LVYRFSAFIVCETSGFCLSICWAVSKPRARFRFQLTAGRRKFGEIWGFSRQFFYRWGKISQVGFQAWPHTKRVCKFRGDPLRKGWELSRNLGPKPTDRRIKKKALRKNRYPYEARIRVSSPSCRISDTCEWYDSSICDWEGNRRPSRKRQQRLPLFFTTVLLTCEVSSFLSFSLPGWFLSGLWFVAVRKGVNALVMWR